MLMITASMEYTTIPIAVFHATHNIGFLSHQSTLPLQTWIYGVKLKALERIAGLEPIGKAKAFQSYLQFVGARPGAMTSALTELKLAALLLSA